jgi:regulatory protein
MPRAAPLETVEAAYEAAVKMLTRKARSASEVRAALLAKGATEEDAESVIGRLKSHRHLDDAVLAADEAYSLLEGKGLSPAFAMHTLTERGLASELVRQCVEEVRDGRSDAVLCERALQKRLRGKPLAEENLGREGRALARLGYEEDVVTQALERATRGSTT